MLLSLLTVALSDGLSDAAVAKDPPFVDTHVAKVQLADEASGKAFVARFGGQQFDLEFGSAVFRYVNTTRSEVLDLVLQPGGSPYGFMQCRIRRAHRAEPKARLAAGLSSFRTGRGVHLGLTVAELTRLVGEQYQETGGGDDHVLVYRCDSPTSCPVLKQVNMPTYEGKYIFRKGTLDAVECGFPYP